MNRFILAAVFILAALFFGAQAEAAWMCTRVPPVYPPDASCLYDSPVCRCKANGGCWWDWCCSPYYFECDDDEDTNGDGDVDGDDDLEIDPDPALWD